MQILSRSLDGLVCKKTRRISVSGVDASQDAKSLDIGFLAVAVMPKAVCEVLQRTTIQATLFGPWQQNRKHMGCKFLKEIILSLGFRQNFLQGSFWLSVIFKDLQQLRSSARREERKHRALESSLRKIQ